MVTGIMSCNFKLPNHSIKDYTWMSYHLWNYIALLQIIGNWKNFMVMKNKFPLGVKMIFLYHFLWF